MQRRRTATRRWILPVGILAIAAFGGVAGAQSAVVPEAQTRGAHVFEALCARCHGEIAQTYERGPVPHDMHISERDARERVRHGIRGHGMPRFGSDRLPNDDLVAVLSFLRSQGGLTPR